MSKMVADLSAVTTVSVDLAKHVFRFTVDTDGKVIGARALRREVLAFFVSLRSCLVGMEAFEPSRVGPYAGASDARRDAP